jgi:hypothetical protein
MPQVSTICPNYTLPAETRQSIYFVQLRKKYLTIVGVLLYNRRALLKIIPGLAANNP